MINFWLEIYFSVVPKQFNFIINKPVFCRLRKRRLAGMGRLDNIVRRLRGKSYQQTMVPRLDLHSGVAKRWTRVSTPLFRHGYASGSTCLFSESNLLDTNLLTSRTCGLSCLPADGSSALIHLVFYNQLINLIFSFSCCQQVLVAGH